MKSLITSILLLTATATFAQQGDGTWHSITSKNHLDGRSECGLVAIGGKLYLVGGDGPAYPVEVYDPKTELWTKKAEAPSVMHHFQPVALGDKLYVLDAFSTTNYPDQTPLPNAYSYDTRTDKWQQLAGLSADRQRAGAGEAVHNGKLYLVCGIKHGHRSGTCNLFDEYDPATNTWTALPDAPHIRDHSQAVVVGDKLYALGGRNTSLHDADNFMSFFDKVVLDVDCYDFKTGKWSTLEARLPQGTGGGTAVNLDNRIYFIGGERATATEPNSPRSDVYFLDPATMSAWKKTANTNQIRNGVGSAVLNGKIYIAGGAGAKGPVGPPPGGKPGSMPPPPPNGQPGPPRNPGDIGLEVFTVTN